MSRDDTVDAVNRLLEEYLAPAKQVCRTPGGLGVGLTVSKKLLEAHGGSIEARSEGPGKGAEFIIELPGCGPAQAAAKT